MEEEMVFRWEVLNISMCPLLTGECLSSPTFYVTETEEVELCLKLFPRGHSPKYDESVTILLCRCSDYGPDSILMNYKLSAFNDSDARKAEYTHVFDKSKILSFKIWQPKYFLELKRKDIFPLQYNDITVKCKIKRYTSHRYFVNYDLDDLEDLSRCFENMLEEGTFSDMNIRTPSQDLKVHQFMLKSRCAAFDPKSVEELRARFPRSCDKAIKIMLRYFYSGKFKYSDSPDEFHTFLKQVDSSVFEHLFSSSCSLTNAVTSFQIEHLSFEWEIQNFFNTSFEEKRSFLVPKPSLCGMLELFIHKKRKKFLHFRIRRMCNERNLSMYCDVSCLKNDGEYHSMFADRHLFLNEEIDWEISICLGNYDFHQRKEILQSDGTLNLNITMNICSGEVTTGIDGEGYAENSDFSSNKKNLCRLARDLQELRANPICSDFKLVVGEKEFKVHKAVLSARSPVFNKMLEHDTIQKRESKVTIEGLKGSAVDSMLSYMYCGEVQILDLESASDLYLAADKYEILKLREKCARYRTVAKSRKRSLEPDIVHNQSDQ